MKYEGCVDAAKLEQLESYNTEALLTEVKITETTAVTLLISVKVPLARYMKIYFGRDFDVPAKSYS